ncbi:MAG: bifunctional folylpolyglutamate synthase/dihydrofolate synthase [Candidatus Puniceispirillales bacterium]
MEKSPLQRAEAALDRLAALHPKLIDLGLDRSFALLDRLGDPHEAMPPALHLAGTNGKGSTLAFLRAMVEAGGMRAHAYTSPHLVRFHERIRLAGTLISDQGLADLLEEVETRNGDHPVTFFEVTTAAAMLAFSRCDAEMTLLETGLGGRLDSTNVLADHLAAIITPIARDHEHFLGSTLTAIATEKAGIMRQGRPVLSARQSPEVMAVLKAEADRIGAQMLVAGEDFTITATREGVTVSLGDRRIEAPVLGLKGDHQKDNAGLAAATLMLVCPQLDDQAIIDGLAAARWPGRVQHLAEGRLTAVLPKGTALWLDGAHNAHGAAALGRTLEQISETPWVLVCGALNTRPPADFLEPLAGLVAEAICLTIPDQPAALNAGEMAKAAKDIGMAATTATDLNDAMEKAATLAERHGGNVVIAGSLYLAGHVLAENSTLPD